MAATDGDYADDRRHEAGLAAPGSWWVLALIVLSYGAYNLDKSIVSILIEPLKAEFSLSDSQMGLLAGMANSLPFALACIPVGMLADRVNRRNLLLVLVAGWSAATGLAGFATSIWLLFVSRVAVGAFEAGFSPTSLSILSDTFPQRLRSTVMGIFSLGAPLGLFFGMAVGGFIEDHYGWRAAFFIAGLPGLIFTLLIWLTLREPARGQFDIGAGTVEPAPLLSTLAHLWKNRALMHITLAMTWCATFLAAIAHWTPSLLRRTFELSASEAGLLSALIVGVAGALGAATGGMVADRLGRDSLSRKLLSPILGTIASIICGLSVFLLHPTLALSVPLLMGAAFFGQYYIGTGYGLAATLSGPAMRATTLSVLLVAFNLISYSAGSLVVGTVSDLTVATMGDLSLNMGMAAAMGFSALGVVHLYLAMRVLKSNELASGVDDR